MLVVPDVGLLSGGAPLSNFVCFFSENVPPALSGQPLGALESELDDAARRSMHAYSAIRIESRSSLASPSSNESSETFMLNSKFFLRSSSYSTSRTLSYSGKSRPLPMTLCMFWIQLRCSRSVEHPKWYTCFHPKLVNQGAVSVRALGGSTHTLTIPARPFRARRSLDLRSQGRRPDLRSGRGRWRGIQPRMRSGPARRC